MSANKNRGSRLSVLWIVWLPLFFTAAYSEGTFPPGFVSTQIVGGLNQPTAMTFAPDGRIFICEQGGDLRIVKNGTLLSKPFLKVTVNSVHERGLLGVALDPNFPVNGYVYVYYTATTPTLHNRVSRFTANGDTALAGSEFILLDMETLGPTNHNGGAVHFGPDGKLYIATGDNAYSNNSQTLETHLGKILRMNSDGTIPTDNPFYFVTTGTKRSIWALGLRNPFTFAFQPGTGRMFINDVGELTWEEINDGIAGSNYGWPITEGYTSDPRFRSPLYAYRHGSGDTMGCSVIGGAFYNPPTVQFPVSYVGDYFFADLCNGWIRIYRPSNGSVRGFATGLSWLVGVEVASDGSLYYLQRPTSGGSLHRVTYTGGANVELTNDEVPEHFHLEQNFPNPFNPTTTIRFKVKEATAVTLKVYNLLGKEIATLVDAELQPGSYSVTFPDSDGDRYPSGVFYYRLFAGSYSETKKMILSR